MNKYLTYILISLVGALAPDIVLSQNHHITVNVSGFRNSKVAVVLYLYNSEMGYPQDHNKAYRTVNGVIINNTCSIVLSDIPKGTYAIACFHDENGNGKLDTNLLGIPDEGVGASNNAKGFMGPPKFKDAKFIVGGDVVMPIIVSH
jgi:uncharacterized protein (DUF2141 family)